MAKLFPQDNNLQPIPAPAGVHSNISGNADSVPTAESRPALQPPASVSSSSAPISPDFTPVAQDSGYFGWEVAFGLAFGIAAVALYLWAKRSK